MTAFAMLGNVRIASGDLAIPQYGLWSADVSLADDVAIPANTSIVLGNLTMACNVYRQTGFAGSRTCRVVAGFGGWRNELAAKQYDLPYGVRLSLVLGDAALEAGEKINVPNDAIIGPGYVREKAPASRTLRQLAGENWYADASGTVQVAAWPTATIKTAYQVIDQDGGQGKVAIATEDYASWMPGTTFTNTFLSGTFTNCGVIYTFHNDGTFRLEVLTQ